MFKRILVAVDGSPTSAKAIRTAVGLAQATRAHLRFVHVCGEPVQDPGPRLGIDLPRDDPADPEKVVADALAISRRAGLQADGKLHDWPGAGLGEAMAAEARVWQADVVVVGTHGRHGIARVLLGSGAEQVIRLAPVPVLAVRLEGTPAAA